VLVHENLLKFDIIKALSRQVLVNLIAAIEYRQAKARFTSFILNLFISP
jgi:hypothetical protein